MPLIYTSPRTCFVSFRIPFPFSSCSILLFLLFSTFFFLNDTAPPEIYTFPYTTLFRSRTESVAKEEAEDGVRRLGREAGLFVGWSTGAAIVAAERFFTALHRPPPPSTAVIVGEK